MRLGTPRNAKPETPKRIERPAPPQRATVVADGVEYEVVWSGHRDGPSLLPDDYPETNGGRQTSIENLRYLIYRGRQSRMGEPKC